jgi:hypothetical protein
MVSLLPLAADDFYTLFTAAMQFNLAKTVPPHQAGWGGSNDGIHYNDKDMIATIGSTNSQYGYMVEIRPVDSLIFRSNQDWSSARKGQIECVLRGNDQDLCSTSVNKAPYAGVCDAAGNITRNWTSSTNGGIYPLTEAGSSESLYFRMPPQSQYSRSWIDLVLVLPALENSDDMSNGDDYSTQFEVLFYPFDSSGNLAATASQSYTLTLTGFYNGSVDSSITDYFQFRLTSLPAANFFDMEQNADQTIDIATIEFTTKTTIPSKWGNAKPTYYEISVGSSPSYNGNGEFFFKRVGTEGRQNTQFNSAVFSVNLVPSDGVSSVKNYYNMNLNQNYNYVNVALNNIVGTESYTSRKITVPVVYTGKSNEGDTFGAKYNGVVQIRLGSAEIEHLQQGVYKATVYVHLVSTR